MYYGLENPVYLSRSPSFGQTFFSLSCGLGFPFFSFLQSLALSFSYFNVVPVVLGSYLSLSTYDSGVSSDRTYKRWTGRSRWEEWRGGSRDWLLRLGIPDWLSRGTGERRLTQVGHHPWAPSSYPPFTQTLIKGTEEGPVYCREWFVRRDLSVPEVQDQWRGRRTGQSYSHHPWETTRSGHVPR